MPHLANTVSPLLSPDITSTTASTYYVTNSTIPVYQEIDSRWHFDPQHSWVPLIDSINKMHPEPVVEKKKYHSRQRTIQIPILKELKLDLSTPDTPPDFMDIESYRIDCKQSPVQPDFFEYELLEIKRNSCSLGDNDFRDYIERNGYKELGRELFVYDDSIKSRFKIRKMIELKKPPSFGRKIFNIQITEPELKARALLKRYVGNNEFKRYLKFGFIILSAHGYDWRIPGENAPVNRVEQYKKNMLIAKYCVHFSDKRLPPTDACIMRMALVQAGIDVIRNSANYYDIGTEIKKSKQEQKILTSFDAYQELKKMMN